MLREVADLSGLTEQVTAVLADTYRGPWVHDPGRVFTDLAAAVADGADCVSGVGSLVDQQVQHGPVASLTTTQLDVFTPTCVPWTVLPYRSGGSWSP